MIFEGDFSISEKVFFYLRFHLQCFNMSEICIIEEENNILANIIRVSSRDIAVVTFFSMAIFMQLLCTVL